MLIIDQNEIECQKKLEHAQTLGISKEIGQREQWLAQAQKKTEKAINKAATAAKTILSAGEHDVQNE